MSAWLLAVACAWGQDPKPTLPAASVTVNDVVITVEIADEAAERTHGLMERASLPDDHGMLFVYPDERPRSFWMKNTPLPLSIAYLDAQGRIVRIADMKPLDESPVPSTRPAMYALEMTRGWFTTHAVAVGMQVKGLPPPASE